MTDRDGIIGSYEAGKTFHAVLILRVVAVLLVMVTLQIRPTLPVWMLEWFGRISWPLLAGSLLLLIFQKKALVLLGKYPWMLYADLLVSVGIIQIGGSWRSSYFGYTITTIILFTLFKGRAGAYLSAILLTLAATVKDPSGGLSSQEVFFVSNWDMRMGAALIYTTAGVILGYFYTLLEKIDTLSGQRITEARKVLEIEVKTRLALELHDGAKQMVCAMILMLGQRLKRRECLPNDLIEELNWLWRGLNYLQGELLNVMNTLKGESAIGNPHYSIVEIAREEAGNARTMTGFSWEILPESHNMYLPVYGTLPLRRFLGEAFMNSWKHSGVTSGTVAIRHVGAEVVITVSDQGKGFVYSDNQHIGSMGLKSLESRASELNGRFFIETAPNEGCKVTLILPACEGE